MSHTLHRRGSVESLQCDIPLLTRAAKGINSEGSAAKLQKFVKIAMTHNPVNLGMAQCGNIHGTTPENIIKALVENRTVNVVFGNKQDFINLLKDLKKEDWDLSVTCAGLFDTTLEACKEAGIKPHSVNFSLGIFGKTEKLPDENILQLTTMCGHHQNAPGLVKLMINEVKAKKITPRTAALTLTCQCPCGIVNVDRAEKMFEKFRDD